MGVEDKKVVLAVFGTRPEAIKMAPVLSALKRESTIITRVLVTAQHRDMLDQVLKIFDIEPDYDLNIMQPDQDLYDITASILSGLRAPLGDYQPDLVLVHGDTTTCFAAALAAYYQNIPVGHVEAGLRTGNLLAPFPEEANRSLVARLARLHFAPTIDSKSNLMNESIAEEHIHVTGNTVIDALLEVAEKVRGLGDDDLDLLTIPKRTLESISRAEKLILITGHRRENFGQGFIDVCAALRRIAESNPNWLLVYPVHLNPNVHKPVHLLLQSCRNIHLIPPQDYLPFVWLLDRCSLVITDSGGIQEEAPSLGKPVLVTRSVTERPEAVEAGTALLVGTDPDYIAESAISILEGRWGFAGEFMKSNPYGDGRAAERVVGVIRNFLKNG